MPRLHALELLPDEAGDAAVRRDWRALRDAGLPSQLDHPAATNTPHVTVLALPVMTAEQEALAREVLGPLLPVRVRMAGLAVLGGPKVTVARLLDVPEALTRAVLELRAGVAGERHPGWLPHVTLARRVPRVRAGGGRRAGISGRAADADVAAPVGPRAARGAIADLRPSPTRRTNPSGVAPGRP